GGCSMHSGTRGTDSAPGDMSSAGGGGGGGGSGDGADLAMPGPGDDHSDGGGVGSLGDGGVFNPPGDMGTVTHAPPGTLAGVVVLGAGSDFRDVSTDEAHGVWATTTSTVYYFHGGATSTYGVGNGLAQGHSTWTTDYWCGPGFGGTCPETYNVTFTSVAGGLPGQVVVGHLGYLADRLNVDPSTGAVQSIVGLEVTATQQPDPTELMAQQQREVASWRVVVDLNGTYNGTAYFGGYHGTSALHNIGTTRSSGICGSGCADFEEHIHGFYDGGTQPGGRDVHALLITPEGDLWMGDADVISFVPQRSVGPNADFFQPVEIPGQPGASSLDVFPGVADVNYGLALDSARGLYVASYGNGLAYLAPGTYAPTYWSSSDKLPQNYLTGVAVDATGDVWIATATAGVVRYQPSSQTWVYYTMSSGLPSNDIRSVYLDKYAASGRGVYFATDNGVAVYTGP
ncbi:MAG: hypothetical protein ACXVCV_20630, partial [Polyangia bacterium]